MPTLAQQLRADRHRRVRRRRATLASVVVVPAVVVFGARLLGDIGGDLAGATSAAATTATTVAAPTTTSVPTGLHPGLVDAFARAQAAARDAGHQLTINSGFRSAAEQAALLDAEVAERGSLEEALWWVFPPDRSMHVQGLAIDVGDGPAADWLAAEGDAFGLCHTLAWEWWHFEWRQRWEDAGSCPDAAQVPSEAPQP